MSEHFYSDENDPNVIVHYGVKGMKWGVRKAGPRSTRAGRKAYRKERSKLEAEMYRKMGSDENKMNSALAATHTRGRKVRKGTRKAIRDRGYQAMAKTETHYLKKLDDLKGKHGVDAKRVERAETIQAVLSLSAIAGLMAYNVTRG